MLKKIKYLLLVFLLIACSSTKNIKKKQTNTDGENDKKSTEWVLIDNKENSNYKPYKVYVYSGVRAIDDVYFKSPSSAIEIGEKILVSDTGNGLIREIKNNKISTYIGNGKGENIEGKLLDASLDAPKNIIKDSKGNIYVVVNYNQIAKIDTEGVVSMFAGKYYRGSIDGKADGELAAPKKTAYFPMISDLVIDKKDNIYASAGHLIRKIDTDGNVTTIAGHNESGDKSGTVEEALFHQINDIAFNKKGDIFVVDQANHKIKKISKKGMVSTILDKAEIYWPTAILINPDGNLIIFDQYARKFYIYSQKGKLINVFDSEKLKGESFHFHVNISYDKKGNIILPSKDFVNIIDKNFKVINQIGEKGGVARNGDIKRATYNIPFDGVFDEVGNLFVLDKGNKVIRKISNSGIVSKFSGSGRYGDVDGIKTKSSFISLKAITKDSNHNLYVIDGDFSKSKIKKIDAFGNVSTFVSPEKSDLKWKRPFDLATDSENILFVSDSENDLIYKVDMSGNLTTFITAVDIKLNSPHGLFIDKNDNLFICDSYNDRIVKVSKNKDIEIIVPNNLSLNEPENITVDDFGNIYVTDKKRTRIVKIYKDRTSEIVLKESTLGTNKDRKLSEYYNTLKLEVFKNDIYVFDKYNHQIIKLEE